MSTGTVFADAVTHAKAIKETHSTREQMYNDLEDIFLLNNTGLPEGAHIKETISPDPSNSLNGAVRLMSGTEPIFTVPVETNSVAVQKKASKIEKAAATWWQACGFARGRSLHQDLVFTALMYGEAHIVTNLTQDWVDSASPEQRPRFETIQKITPVFFDIISPRVAYPEFGKFGLNAHYSVESIVAREVVNRYGPIVQKQLGDVSLSSKIEVNEYWNDTWHIAWITGQKEPLILVEHKLGFIPISTRLMEGSEMLQRSGQQTRHPFLYNIWKTNLWKRQNLALTVMYSMIFAVGANPAFVLHQGTPDADVSVDLSRAGGVTKVPPGSKFDVLKKEAIDPSIQIGLSTADTLTGASTMYRQALGEPLGANAPFSMVALLSQAGRLPLVPYQRGCSDLIAEAMYKGLQMMRMNGKDPAKNLGGPDLRIKEIPEVFTLKASLDIKTPTDDRQNATIALQLAGGAAPLTSKRYVREDFLKIGQSDDMDREIYEEQAMALEYQRLLAQQMKNAQSMEAGGPGNGNPVAPNLPGGAQGNMDVEQLMSQAGPQPGGLGQMAEPLTQPVQPSEGPGVSPNGGASLPGMGGL